MVLLTANLDSPIHSAWTYTKHSNARTERPCQACNIKRDDLGNPNYDTQKNARTTDGIRRDLEYVKATATSAEATDRSRKKGVVVGSYPNPLSMVVYDSVRQTGMDILHQVYLNHSTAVRAVFPPPSRFGV